MPGTIREEGRQGYFITFEGVEGCGKTTQVRMLAEFLEREERSVRLTREPGGTPVGEKIREILLDPAHEGLAPVAEMLLYISARAELVRSVIRPAIDAGCVVICDRFIDATFAYQARGRGLDEVLINSLNRLAADRAWPDLTILLDMDPALGLDRVRERIRRQGEGKEDRFEQEALAFHQRVRDGYLEIARREPERVRIVDALGSVEDVHAAVLKTVQGLFRPH